ncbi:MAG TPA: fibronectin type III domain-containing protein [Thermomonospora sp.]|nr:fibronectin type III domain-containing protein [Thermomonospora sp.]
MRDRIAVIGLRIRRGASAGTVAALALALVATVFGVGALGRAAKVHDGSVWLWSSKGAQVSRVNAQTGRVDLRQPVIDSRGNRVRVTQNDRYLILHDLVTGRVTSVDLKSLGFSGRLDVGARGDFRFVLGEHGAFIVDRVTGEIRVVNPATLQPTGASLRLPGPLVGGDFDTYGMLWVASPGQGTAIGVRVSAGRPVMAETVPVARPGRDLAVTVLDRGLLAVDRGGRELVTAAGGKARRIASPVPLTGATLPDRTPGSLAAVTVPAARAVVSVNDVIDPGKTGKAEVTRLADPRAGTAVPYSGRLYVPDSDGRRVRVYEPGGRQVSVITIPGGGGGLELQVHENSLFINDPGGRNAAVVGSDGEVKVIDKDEGPSTIGGDRTPAPQPSPGPRDTPTPSDRPVPPTQRPDDPPGRTRPPNPVPTPSGPTGGPTGQPTVTPTTSPSPSAPPAPGSPPGAPVPVSAYPGDRQVRLTWFEPHSPDAPVDSYRVTWNGGERTVPGGQLGTTVTGLTNGRVYRFRVAATNRYGTGPFAQSEEARPTPDRPATPTGVTAEVRGDMVTVSWNQVPGADSYSVTATNHSGGQGYPTRTTSSSPLVIASMPPGRWSFTVVARNAEGGSSGTSAPSNTVVVESTPPPSNPPPSNPPPSVPPPTNPPPDPMPTAPAPDPGPQPGVTPIDPGPDDGKPGEIPGHPPATGLRRTS